LATPGGRPQIDLSYTGGERMLSAPQLLSELVGVPATGASDLREAISLDAERSAAPNGLPLNSCL